MEGRSERYPETSCVAVGLGVRVRVGVAVRVGVEVGVFVGVEVGVGVWVGVGVSVGVGCRNGSAEQLERISVIKMETHIRFMDDSLLFLGR